VDDRFDPSLAAAAQSAALTSASKRSPAPANPDTRVLSTKSLDEYGDVAEARDHMLAVLGVREKAGAKSVKPPRQPFGIATFEC
jgi:hypothetical protein